MDPGRDTKGIYLLHTKNAVPIAIEHELAPYAPLDPTQHIIYIYILGINLANPGCLQLPRRVFWWLSIKLSNG